MKFVINAEQLLKTMPPSDYFGIVQGNQLVTYQTMLKCVADDEGNILTEREARAEIDALSNNSMAEFGRVQGEFIRALSDALVTPTSAAH